MKIKQTNPLPFLLCTQHFLILFKPELLLVPYTHHILHCYSNSNHLMNLFTLILHFCQRTYHLRFTLLLLASCTYLEYLMFYHLLFQKYLHLRFLFYFLMPTTSIKLRNLHYYYFSSYQYFKKMIQMSSIIRSYYSFMNQKDLAFLTIQLYIYFILAIIVLTSFLAQNY